MSPEDMQAAKDAWRFPRVSGDEPVGVATLWEYMQVFPA